MGSADFEAFITGMRPRLGRAFVAAYGVERGAEALSESLAVAWERFEEVSVMANPAGYLFRVGQSRSRPRKRVEASRFPPPAELGLPDVEPGLPDALACLTERQRVCVVLVHGYDWTQREAAELLNLSASAVQNHVERGIRRLRHEMGVQRHADR